MVIRKTLVGEGKFAFLRSELGERGHLISKVVVEKGSGCLTSIPESII